MVKKITYNVQPFRSQEEIDDFLFFLRRTKNSKRDVFLFLFGLNTGLRMSDIVRLKVGDINKSEPVITEKKTGKRKRLFLDGIQDIIKEYISDMSGIYFRHDKVGTLKLIPFTSYIPKLLKILGVTILVAIH